MSLVTLRDQATFLRGGLLLGLIPGDLVIRWAESVIAREPEPPAALFDVVVTARGDLTAMRAAVAPLAEANESPAIVRELLGLVHRDLEDGRRSVKDTVTVLSQIRKAITIEPALAWAIDGLEDDFMLATAGVVGDVAEKGAAVHAWLGQFAEDSVTSEDDR